jgi:predicted acyltransferase (DUF342 family)
MGSDLVFDRSTFVLPDGSHFLEHVIETTGDTVLGDHTQVEYGITTPQSVYIGDGVDVRGDLRAGEDVRMDVFTTVDGEVKAEGSAYLGEGVRVTGRLSVMEDLDVGDEVTLEEGFEARGWINIRNPVPTVVYVVIYLMQLMRQGNSEEVQKMLDHLEEAQQTFEISETFMFVPNGSHLGLQESHIRGGMRTGADCRVLGNFRTEDDARLGRATELHGSLRVQGGVHLESGAVVHGDVEAWDDVYVGEDVVVHGTIEAQSVDLRPSAEVKGTIKAPEGVRFRDDASLEMEQKVQDFEDDVHQISEMLE